MSTTNHQETLLYGKVSWSNTGMIWNITRQFPYSKRKSVFSKHPAAWGTSSAGYFTAPANSKVDNQIAPVQLNPFSNAGLRCDLEGAHWKLALLSEDPQILCREWNWSPVQLKAMSHCCHVTLGEPESNEEPLAIFYWKKQCKHDAYRLKLCVCPCIWMFLRAWWDTPCTKERKARPGHVFLNQPKSLQPGPH